MIPKSIKWRLQLWYGLILVAVLAGFGVTAYQLEWGRQMRLIDGALKRRLDALSFAVHPPPDPNHSGMPFNHLPPDFVFPDRPPRGNPPPPPNEFHLSPYAASLFETNETKNFYFVVKTRSGKEISRSANVPNQIATQGQISIDQEFSGWLDWVADNPSPSPLNIINRDRRETFNVLPSGEAILVGCSIKPELKELRLTALKLTTAGGIILLVGLVGGWWLVGRALRPIANISATAAKISAGDLAQRISTAETDSELGQLAGVLNSTFARLEAAFAQQRQFTADAAHELRTPVSVMLTQAQTALTRDRSAAEYRETVEACQRAAQRMRRLTESLLELARLDAGQETLKRVKFDLAQTAQDCAELVRPLAATRGITIRCDLAPVETNGDPERLAQVITNLLTNAVQYGKANSEVSLSAKLQGRTILLAVSDTGPGISREDLPHVFERFYRADASRSSGQTGLGLAISKAIVEVHGGTIDVSSQPGSGTTFTVVLPAM
jgi:two-component system, OmpR family, sensor kinase